MLCGGPIRKEGDDGLTQFSLTQFQSEKDYLAARDIAVHLLKAGYLSREEFVQIDTNLRQKISPRLGALLADFPCYS